MNPGRAVSVLTDEATTFTALLTTDALTAPVPTCPGWAVADLARHLGGVHRWARHAVLFGPGADFEGPTDDGQVLPWFREGAAALIETLTKTQPRQACWTFDETGAAAFWMRRQAHETTLHRWDLQNSQGVAGGIAADVALDGIDEVATMFVPRQVRLGRLASGPEAIQIVPDQGPPTRLSATAEPASTPSSASVHGPAEALLLLLWKRTTLDDPRLSVSGSRSSAERLLAKPLTP